MSKSCDDFIRSTGHLAFVNLFLKYAVAVLGLAVLALTGCLVYLSGEVGQVRPLPIYINTLTGEAKPVDFSVIDAQGRERLPAEIEHFVRRYLDCLYTFTRLTVKSNLDQAAAGTAPAAWPQVKAAVDLARRADRVAADAQGLCEILSVSIMTTRPNVRVQAVFTKKVFGPQDDVAAESTHIAFLTLKPIARQVQNAHGLAVVEYSENIFHERDTP